MHRKASSSFGRLQLKVWNSHDQKLSIKIAIDREIVVSTLIYAAENWTPHKQHLEKILKVSWQNLTTNVEMLKMADLNFIQTEIGRRQLRWARQVMQMPNHRIPKKLLHGELKQGTCPQRPTKEIIQRRNVEERNEIRHRKPR